MLVFIHRMTPARSCGAAGFPQAATRLGIRCLQDRVVDIEDNVKVTAVKLESSETLTGDIFINAANCWAPDLCRIVGMEIRSSRSAGKPSS